MKKKHGVVILSGLNRIEATVKKQSIILAVLLAAIIIPLTGCDKISEEQKPFIGKWKLMTVSDKLKHTRAPRPFEPPAHDYSENNVIYEFRKNGDLRITSDVEDIAGLQPGKYSYKVRPYDNTSARDILIDEYSCIYSVGKDGLTLIKGYGEDVWRCELTKIE